MRLVNTKLPRLVDPDYAVVEIDVADTDGADLAEPRAGADRHAQQVAVDSREPPGGLQLSLGEEPQLRSRLLDPGLLGRRTDGRVGSEIAALHGVGEDPVDKAVVVGLGLQRPPHSGPGEHLELPEVALPLAG